MANFIKKLVKRKNTLAGKQLAFILLFSSCVTLLGTSLQLYLEYRADVRQIHGQFEIIEKSHLKAITNSLWTLDNKQIMVQLNDALNLRDIVFLEVREGKRVLYSAGKFDNKITNIFRTYPMNYYRKGIKNEIGKLYVSASLENTYNRLIKRVAIVLITQGVKTFIVSFFILFIIYRLVTRHLISIADQAKKITYEGAEGGLILKRKSNNNEEGDELTYLVDSFNRMYKKMQGDIAKQKETEKLLRKSEKNIRMIFEAAENVAFIVTDLEYQNSKICDISPGGEKIFQCRRDDVIGKEISVFMPEETLHRFCEMQDVILKSSLAYSEEVFLKKVSGLNFPAEFNLYPKKNNSGEITGTIAVAIDITRLRREEARYKNTITSSIDGFLILGENGKIVDVNEAFCKISGFGYSELLFEEQPDEVREVTGEIMNTIELMPDISNKRFETILKDKKGNVYNVEISITKNNYEEELYFVFVRDITEKKNSEKLKQIMEASILQKQKLETIGTLAGGIAHDFNNILFPIVGYSEMLLEDLEEDDPSKESIMEIYTSAMRAKNLVKQILSFSLKGSGDTSHVLVQSVIKDALSFIKETFPSKIIIDQEIDSDCGFIKADAAKIHQIFMNLATNALHSMEEKGGKLKISVKRVSLILENFSENNGDLPASFVCLTVRDTGTGFSDSVKEKIFDPFFTTKPPGKGTGMGLSVVHGLVRNMNGRIEVKSIPKHGTEFKIFFPELEKPEIVDNEFEEKIERGGGEHIIVVDDETAVLTMVGRILERIGYKVSLFDNSGAALEKFKSNSEGFDAVISDLDMPGMSGKDLCREIKRIRKDVPIILYSGLGEIEDKENFKELGVSALLSKPVRIREVADALKNIFK